MNKVECAEKNPTIPFSRWDKQPSVLFTQLFCRPASASSLPKILWEKKFLFSSKSNWSGTQTPSIAQLNSVRSNSIQEQRFKFKVAASILRGNPRLPVTAVIHNLLIISSPFISYTWLFITGSKIQACVFSFNHKDCNTMCDTNLFSRIFSYFALTTRSPCHIHHLIWRDIRVFHFKHRPKVITKNAHANNSFSQF